MKVLWLASWYPSELRPLDGDFIQRHAHATALFTDIELIHVVKDADGIITDHVKEIVTVNNRLTEKIIYYKPAKTSIPIIDRFLSHVKYRKVYREAVRKYIDKNGKPQFIHLHIAMKAGLVALWLKRKMNVPYVLTEHWGGYLTNANPNIKDYNFVYRNYWKKIVTGAKASSFVSTAFEKHMINLYQIKNSCVIPNVVNTEIFYPAKKTTAGTTRFIHASILTYQKNAKDILTALSLIKNRHSFEMVMFGPFNPALERMIRKLGLENQVFLKGEVPHSVLSKEMQQSDALIQYSRYETFGCVLIEANACGVPVIVSNLEVFHEIVEERVNGIFVECENPAALAEKIQSFIALKNNFNKEEIAAVAAEKYNYYKVGKQFVELYENMQINLQ